MMAYVRSAGGSESGAPTTPVRGLRRRVSAGLQALGRAWNRGNLARRDKAAITADDVKRK